MHVFDEHMSCTETLIFKSQLQVARPKTLSSLHSSPERNGAQGQRQSRSEEKSGWERIEQLDLRSSLSHFKTKLLLKVSLTTSESSSSKKDSYSQ